MNSTEKISNLLNERVKELNCLYEISKICQDYNQSFKTTITTIIKAIPQGWQYSKQLQVYFILDNEVFGNQPKSTPSAEASSNIIIDKEKRGEIVVYYTDNKHSFLDEEQPLLDKIGIEITTFVERFEQRKNEKIMAEKMRYNDRLAVLGELTAGIAHELNTPLGNILGYAELLEKAEINPIKKADTKKIITSAKNAREIVKRLMYFSCEMPQQFGIVNMNEQIEENIGLLQKQLTDNKVLLKLNLATNIPLLRMDKLQFSQLVFNLVLNAINAMDGKGKISITTRLNSKGVLLCIKDNGIGMSAENKAKIFQPFFTTKPKGEGTGLGLAVVQGIIQNHKGSITVDTEINKGTQFNITFPIETD